MRPEFIFSRLVLTAFVAVLLTSCNLQKSNPLDLSEPVLLPEVPMIATDLINFKVVNSQVLEKHCVGCHSEKAGNKGGVNLETYENVLKDIALVRETIQQKTMPPKRRIELKLTDSQIKLILNWIEAGAKKETDENPSVDNPPIVIPPTTPPPTTTPPVVEPPPIVVPPILGEVYFADVNQFVLQTNCVGCHSEARGNKGGINLESYAAVKHDLKEIKESILDGFMPPKRGKQLTDEQKKLILNWIEAGAKEKAEVAPEPPVVPEPPPVIVDPPPKTEILFAEVMEKVIELRCARCHSEQGGNEGDVNLETYENVFKFASDIKNDVEGGFMPPRRSTQLTEEQKKMLLDWIAAGAKEK